MLTARGPRKARTRGNADCQKSKLPHCCAHVSMPKLHACTSLATNQSSTPGKAEHGYQSSHLPGATIKTITHAMTSKSVAKTRFQMGPKAVLSAFAVAHSSDKLGLKCLFLSTGAASVRGLQFGLAVGVSGSKVLLGATLGLGDVAKSADALADGCGSEAAYHYNPYMQHIMDRSKDKDTG